jgi:hypothetical protein
LLQAAVSLGNNRRSGADKDRASHCGAVGFSAVLTGTKIELTNGASGVSCGCRAARFVCTTVRNRTHTF